MKPYIVLVLQGGGALGAYHIGAYRALAEAGYAPDWIAGISIGAINGAILAGNEPAERLGFLEAFWHDISRDGGVAQPAQAFSFWQALVLGQPNFFTPRLLSPYFAAPGTVAATSFYDTAALGATLERVVNFALLDAASVRLSLGATDLQTGELVFFDNTAPKRAIRAEHVMASGALPPGFPAVLVDGRPYWDGGCVSNSPLDAVLHDPPPGHTIVFMIDLWSASGAVPATMEDVLARQKSIQYASRTCHSIEAVAAKLDLRCLRSPDAGSMRMDIVHVVYRPDGPALPSADAEFSRDLIAERREAGYADLRHALAGAPWAGREANPSRVAVHRVSGGQIVTVSG